MSDIAIRVENISKKYDIGDTSSGSLRETIAGFFSKNGKSKAEEFWALKDISFDVKRGEAIGVIGKNGAGKSTLLKVLSRITEPTAGRIEINGRVSSLLEVGTGFHPELTGRENVFLNGTVLGMKRAEVKAKFDEIVAFSGVEKFLDTPVKRYSSGMKVRLAFAVAAHLEPEILIIDEVLAVGDAEFQKKCLGKMNEVAGHGRTIIFVSHNMAAVSNLCSRGILLKNGLIAFSGNVQNTVEEYLLLNKADNYANLRDIKERSGSGEVVITDIKFMDYNRREPTINLIAGQDVIIEVSYESKKGADSIIKDLNIGISFFTKLDEFKTVLNSKMSSNAFSNVPSNGKIYCRVKKLPFMYGNLSGTITLRKDNILTDQIQNAFSISIESGDYYNTAKDNSYKREGIYVEHEWSNDMI